MRYLFLILLCISCSDDNFRKVDKLESFRILGAYTPTPEVTPGTAVTVQLLVSDVYGTDATIAGTFERCLDPGISRGAKVDCSLDPSKVTGAHTITFASLQPTPDLRTGLNAATVSFSMPSTILDNRSSKDQFNGVGYIVIFRFTVDGQEHIAFKRIIATNRGTLNTNPSGTVVFLNGSPIGNAPADGDSLTVTTSGPETYEILNSENVLENRSEEFEVAWYTTEGKFDKPKSDIGEKVKFKGWADSSSVLLTIIRDERGGLDFVKSYFP